MRQLFRVSGKAAAACRKKSQAHERPLQYAGGNHKLKKAATPVREAHP